MNSTAASRLPMLSSMASLRMLLAACAAALVAAPNALANEPFWTQRPDLSLQGNQLYAGNGGWSSYSGPVTKNLYRFIRDGVVVKGLQGSVPKSTNPNDPMLPGVSPDDPGAPYYTLTAADNGHCFVAEVYGGTRSTYVYADGTVAYDYWEWGHLNDFGQPAVTNQVCIGGTPAPPVDPTPPPPPVPPEPPKPPPPPQLVFPWTSLGVGIVGVAYSRQLQVQNGTAPSFAVGAGTLPPGLTLSSAGALGGIPTKAGVFEFTVSVTDPVAKPVSYPLTIHVTAPSLAIGPQTLRGARANVPYSQQLVVVGGYAPYAFSVVAGELPNGMTLSPEGLLSGTPDAAAGQYRFTAQTTDRYGLTTTLELVFTVLPPKMFIETATLPGGFTGRAYRATIVAGGGGAPYTFEIVQGKLPPGIVLDSSGKLRGRPTRAGQFGFTVEATDANGVVRKRYFGIRIRQAAR